MYIHICTHTRMYLGDHALSTGPNSSSALPGVIVDENCKKTRPQPGTAYIQQRCLVKRKEKRLKFRFLFLFWGFSSCPDIKTLRCMKKPLHPHLLSMPMKGFCFCFFASFTASERKTATSHSQISETSWFPKVPDRPLITSCEAQWRPERCWWWWSTHLTSHKSHCESLFSPPVTWSPAVS